VIGEVSSERRQSHICPRTLRTIIGEERAAKAFQYLQAINRFLTRGLTVLFGSRGMVAHVGELLDDHTLLCRRE
jgi:hypothetical protein